MIGQVVQMTATGMLVGPIVSLAVSLVKRVILARIRRATDACQQRCDKSILPNIPVRSLKVSVCAAQCRVSELKKMISEIQASKGSCKTSNAPNQCEYALLSQIVKVEGMLKSELAHLQKVSDSYQKKLRTSGGVIQKQLMPEKIS